jgi:hypothetical protein
VLATDAADVPLMDVRTVMLTSDADDPPSAPEA